MHKQFNKSEIKELNNCLSELFSINNFITKKNKVERRDDVIYVDNKPMFFYFEDKIVPTLKLLQEQNILKKIIVDMGAVKFVVSGADIMRPGVVEIEEGIKKDDFIVIVDETHNKPLAIGTAMFSTDEMKTMTSGKCVKSVHYVGDKLWDSWITN